MRANETLRMSGRRLGRRAFRSKRIRRSTSACTAIWQGLNKSETAKQYGEQQVKIWRRSYHIRPPGGESLKDTAERVLPYSVRWIKPCRRGAGDTIIIAAHGNSLRALVMHLDQLSKEQVLKLHIPTGAPLVYNIGEGGKVLDHRYLVKATEWVSSRLSSNSPNVSTGTTSMKRASSFGRWPASTAPSNSSDCADSPNTEMGDPPSWII